MTRGRKLGSLGAGSWNRWLSGFTPGDMRTINTPLSRSPPSMAGMRFTTSLFTAVSASKAGDIRYLIAVERIT